MLLRTLMEKEDACEQDWWDRKQEEQQGIEYSPEEQIQRNEVVPLALLRERGVAYNATIAAGMEHEGMEAGETVGRGPLNYAYRIVRNPDIGRQFPHMMMSALFQDLAGVKGEALTKVRIELLKLEKRTDFNRKPDEAGPAEQAVREANGRLVYLRRLPAEHLGIEKKPDYQNALRDAETAKTELDGSLFSAISAKYEEMGLTPEQVETVVNYVHKRIDEDRVGSGKAWEVKRMEMSVSGLNEIWNG